MHHDKDSGLPTYRHKNRLSTIYEEDKEKDESPNSNLDSSRSSSPINLEEDELYKNISNVDNKLDSHLIKKYFDKKSLLELFTYLRYSKGRIVSDTKIIYIKVR